MKIFIVNLKRSVERRNKIASQLDALNLDYEFVEAVDGTLMTADERAAASATINYAFLPGEIGCALSHQKIYQKIVDSNIEAAMILEDDIIFTREASDVLEKIKPASHRPEVILFSRANSYLSSPVSHLTHKHTLHKTLQATTTHSYVINHKAAQSLLKNLHPIWITADKWTLFEEHAFVSVFSVIPHPVQLSEEDSQSTINGNNDMSEIARQKKAIWNQLMSSRPLKARLKHRFRRAIVPLFYKIVDQGKG